MSKAIRIREHLYKEIEALAKTERRSLISQLEVLLEQALQLPENFDKPKEWPASNEPRKGIKHPADGTLSPPISSRPKKRLHPCKHHVPPHRVCEYCDV